MTSISRTLRKTTRAYHPKSRTGCKICKSRKIKCDERRPSCHKCLQRGLKCIFDDAPKPRSSPSTSLSPEYNSQWDDEHPIDLELLHHFTISTYATLATDIVVRDFWRVNVPQIGFTHRYVLDAVLALSALHLARSDHNRRDILFTQALCHHNRASTAAMPLMANFAVEDCCPLWIFGQLTLFFALGSLDRRPDDIIAVSNGAVPDWLFLVRGSRSLLETGSSAVTASAASAVFKSRKRAADYWEAHSLDTHEPLKQLEQNILRHSVDDKLKQSVLLAAVGTLKRSYAWVDSDEMRGEDEITGVCLWLFTLKDDYLQLLKDTDGTALCVLAFWCVLLRVLEPNWWMSGWPIHILRRIYLQLDDMHRLWIRWPIEELGWVPC